MFLSDWAGPEMAHVILSFGFEDGEYLAWSIEVRRSKGGAFSPVADLFKSHPLDHRRGGRARRRARALEPARRGRPALSPERLAGSGPPPAPRIRDRRERPRGPAGILQLPDHQLHHDRRQDDAHGGRGRAVRLAPHRQRFPARTTPTSRMPSMRACPWRPCGSAPISMPRARLADGSRSDSRKLIRVGVPSPQDMAAANSRGLE